MNNATKYLGITLVVFGALVLIQLVFSILGYLSDFETNPIYKYVVGNQSTPYLVTVNDNEVALSSDVNRIVALFLGVMVLNIWVGVGTALIKAGRSLLVDDMANLKMLLSTLLEKKP